MKKTPAVLFICKQRAYGLSSGLANSAKFVAEMLSSHGIRTEVVSVVDANCIDREVTRFKPTHVMAEAIWVPPSKFPELARLHPHVQWAVRIHSKTPFIATEGISIEWIKKYYELGKKMKLDLAPNSKSFHHDLHWALGFDSVVLLNYYPIRSFKPLKRIDSEWIDIGCFGAVRPLKNQLIQAMAAMGYANYEGKLLRFHMNVGRVERGDEEMKTIRALFKGTEHELVEHPWLAHDKFLELVRKMDVGLQVSLSESYNIVAADFVTCGVPIVGSPDIEWLNRMYTANPNSSADIRTAIKRVLFLDEIGSNWFNLHNLKEMNHASEKTWLEYLNY